MKQVTVGLVGTGYAARLRAETLAKDGRSRLVAATGHSPSKSQEFSQTFEVPLESSWQALVQRSDVDLVMVCTINRDHGAIAQAALEAGKHVVVEYPLALTVAEAEFLLTLATRQQKLLHIEHIELLSGIHQTLRDALPAIGTPFYVRYSNLNPQHPAPDKWTYHPELFGFPFIGALSRLHRMTDLFGAVKTVSCQARFWGQSGLPSPYTTCLCSAQLRFASGLVGEVIYGKGEALWQTERSFVVQGEKGAIALEGEQGNLIQGEQVTPLEVGSRRGLFARDTTEVLDHLLMGTPLYVDPQSSVYALQVAEAAQRSAETGETIIL